MDPETLWYGLALLIGLAAPYHLTRHECWVLERDLPTGKRVCRAVFWGVVYTIVSFAFCIDIAKQPVSNAWGLAILGNAVFWSPFRIWTLSLGRPVWVRREE